MQRARLVNRPPAVMVNKGFKSHEFLKQAFDA